MSTDGHDQLDRRGRLWLAIAAPRCGRLDLFCALQFRSEEHQARSAGGGEYLHRRAGRLAQLGYIARAAEWRLVYRRPSRWAIRRAEQGKYDVALSSGTVGASVAREDVAKFMLTLLENKSYEDGAVSVGGNAPRTGH